MSRQRARCNFTGCKRFVRPGFDRCTDHRNQVDTKGKPPNRMHRELSAKNYGKYTPLILQTAADDDGLDTEIQVLRATLARVMDEETDPARLAAAVSKISATIIQAMKARKTLSGQTADEFTDAVAFILEELHQ